MAVGVRGMAAQKAIVRRLTALEALGSVTNICSDKTGTLTEGKMVVKAFWLGETDYAVSGKGLDPVGDVSKVMEDGSLVKVEPSKVAEIPSLLQGLLTCVLCSTCSLFFDTEEQRWKSMGAPTEVALLVVGNKMEIRKEE